jgi:hypothetical protein
MIPIALSQQSDINGRPLAGAQLYVYQAGTVNTPQNAYQDFALTMVAPWPLVADSTGRLPLFFLATGQVHVRLVDVFGAPVFDVTMPVLGPAGGTSGGGGGTVDPTTIATTGDIKFRATGEVLTGWVRLNGQTIGSASSGASARANADAQNLFVYLWTNCTNAHCPVLTGRGANALADFNAGKQLAVLDWRGRLPVGLDDMGASSAGRILSSNVTSGGGDSPTTPGATGGEANHALSVGELAAHNHTITDPGHIHTYGAASLNAAAGGGGLISGSSLNTGSATTGITVNNTGSGAAHNTMPPFVLGTWYIRL